MNRSTRIIHFTLGAILFFGGLTGLIVDHYHRSHERSPFAGPPYNPPDIKGVKP